MWRAWQRRLGLLCAVGGSLSVALLLLLLLWRPPSLQEQLESAQWRDVEPGAEAEALTFTRVNVAADHQPCSQRLQVGVIFTKADRNELMRPNFERLLGTAAAHTTACIQFHMFTDTISRAVVRQAFDTAAPTERFQVTYHDIGPMAEQTRSLIELMQQHFAPRAGSYYNDVLFFLTTTLHRTLPNLSRIIMLDIDISVRADLALLERHFNRFSQSHVMGLTQELSPVYRHVLEQYRASHSDSHAGGPPPDGFPGFNSGVVLLDLDRMRHSTRYNALITPEEIQARVARYSFKGHLGDQDLYTLLALDDRELFYTLPCGWNRQLCRFWQKQLPDVFDRYYRCDGEVYILHGNCRTPIPAGGEVRV